MEKLYTKYKAELQNCIDDCNNDTHKQEIILAQTEENLLQIEKRKELINYFNFVLDDLYNQVKPKPEGASKEKK